MPDDNRIPTGRRSRIRHTSTRWLKWDGVPDLYGTCNQVRDPIDPNKGPLDPSLILRLKHLGFDIGNGNDAKKFENVWMALKEITGYMNQPPLQDADIFLKNTLPTDFEGDIIQILQVHGKAVLEEMDDPMDSNAGMAWGYSTQDYFQVQVKSVPKNFCPIQESAGIKVEMIGKADIKSMLVRIFPGSAVHPVYQELYDENSIATLPKLKPKTGNIIKHHPHKEFLMLQKRNELGGLFTRLQDPNLFNRARGPYTVEIWISPMVDAFDRDDKGILYPKNDVPLVYDKFLTGIDEEGKNQIGRPCLNHPAHFLENNELILFDPFVVGLEKAAYSTYMTLWARAKFYKSQHCANLNSIGVCAAASRCLKPATCTAGHWTVPELAGTFENISRHINRLEQQFCCGELSKPKPGPIANLKAEIPGVLATMRTRIEDLTRINYPYRLSLEFIGRFVIVIEHIMQITRVGPELDHYAKVYGLAKSDPSLIKKGRNSAEVWRQATGQKIDPVTPTLQPTLMESYNLGLPGPKGDHDHLPEVLLKQEIIAIPSYNPLDTVFFRRTRQVPLFVLALIDFKNIIADRTYMSPQLFFNHDCFHIVGTLPYNTGATPNSAQLWDSAEGEFINIKAPIQISRNLAPSREDVYAYWNQISNHIEGQVNLLDAEVIKLAGEEKILRKGTDTVSHEHKIKELKKMETFRDGVNILIFTLIHEPIGGDQIFGGNQQFPDDKAFKWPVTLDKAYMLRRLNIRHHTNTPNGFFTVVLDRFKTGFFGRLRDEEYYKPAQIALLEASKNCSACAAGTCAGLTPASPYHPPLLPPEGCARGWIVNVLNALPDF